MLAFVTSLRHPHNSTDYRRVEALLADTLASVGQQTDPDFRVWVVGNRRPADLPRWAEWVGVDFPAPSATRAAQTGRAAVLRDKGTKLAVGAAAAARADPSHIMFVDADDMVSRRLAEHVHAHPSAPGWRITEGWRWASERASVRPQHDFHMFCGTAHLVRTDLLGIPPELDATTSQEDIEDLLGERLEIYFGSHLRITGELERRGTPLAALPFAGALYRVGTGENHSGISLGGLGRPVTRAIAQEFGIPRTGRTPWSLARAILPSRRAFAERLPGTGRR